jgi:hypothetical protein
MKATDIFKESEIERKPFLHIIEIDNITLKCYLENNNWYFEIKNIIDFLFNGNGAKYSAIKEKIGKNHYYMLPHEVKGITYEGFKIMKSYSKIEDIEQKFEYIELELSETTNLEKLHNKIRELQIEKDRYANNQKRYSNLEHFIKSEEYLLDVNHRFNEMEQNRTEHPGNWSDDEILYRLYYFSLETNELLLEIIPFKKNGNDLYLFVRLNNLCFISPYLNLNIDPTYIELGEEKGYINIEYQKEYILTSASFFFSQHFLDKELTKKIEFIEKDNQKIVELHSYQWKRVLPYFEIDNDMLNKILKETESICEDWNYNNKCYKISNGFIQLNINECFESLPTLCSFYKKYRELTKPVGV